MLNEKIYVFDDIIDLDLQNDIKNLLIILQYHFDDLYQ